MVTVSDDTQEEDEYDDFHLKYSAFLEIYTSDLESKYLTTAEFKSTIPKEASYYIIGRTVKENYLEKESIKPEFITCGLMSNNIIESLSPISKPCIEYLPSRDVYYDMSIDNKAKQYKFSGSDEKDKTSKKNTYDIVKEKNYVLRGKDNEVHVMQGQVKNNSKPKNYFDTKLINPEEQSSTDIKNRLDNVIELNMENIQVEKHKNNAYIRKKNNMSKNSKLSDINNNEKIIDNSKIICLENVKVDEDSIDIDNDSIESLEVKVEVFETCNQELKRKNQASIEEVDRDIKRINKKVKKEILAEKASHQDTILVEQCDKKSIKSEVNQENKDILFISQQRNNAIADDEDDDVMILEAPSTKIELIDISTDDQEELDEKRPLSSLDDEIEIFDVKQYKEKLEKIKKSCPKLEDVEKIRLSGEQMEKYMKLPMFSTVVIGCFVKLKIFRPSGNSFIKMSEILDVVETDSYYQLGSIRTNAGIKIRSRVYNQVFPLSNIIDYNFFDHEFEEWLEECYKNKYQLPTIEHIFKKETEIIKIENYQQAMDNDPFCLGNNDYAEEKPYNEPFCLENKIPSIESPYWLKLEEGAFVYCDLCKMSNFDAKIILYHVVSRRHTLKAAASLQSQNILNDAHIIKTLIFNQAFTSKEQEAIFNYRIFLKCPSCEISFDTVRKMVYHFNDVCHTDNEVMTESFKSLFDNILKMLEMCVNKGKISEGLEKYYQGGMENDLFCLDEDPFCTGNNTHQDGNKSYWLKVGKGPKFYCNLCKKFMASAKDILYHIISRKHTLKGAGSLEAENILKDAYIIMTLITHQAFKNTQRDKIFKTRILFKCPICKFTLDNVRKLVEHFMNEGHLDEEAIKTSLGNLFEIILKKNGISIKKDNKPENTLNEYGKYTQEENSKLKSKKLDNLNVQKSNYTSVERIHNEENEEPWKTTLINQQNSQGVEEKPMQQESRKQESMPNSVTESSPKKCFLRCAGNWFDRMLECQRCKQWFHETCVGCLSYKLIHGDRFYLYVCEFCNNGKEFIHRLPLSWEDIVHLALWNLLIYTNLSENGIYFDYKEQIVPWVNNHWELLQCPPEFQTIPVNERSQNIFWALQGNSNKFSCGKEFCNKARILKFKLKRKKPPSVLDIILPQESPFTEAMMDMINYSDRTKELTPIPETFKINATEADIPVFSKSQVETPYFVDPEKKDDNKVVESINEEIAESPIECQQKKDGSKENEEAGPSVEIEHFFQSNSISSKATSMLFVNNLETALEIGTVSVGDGGITHICNVCNLSSQGREPMMTHIGGKKHKKAVRCILENGEIESEDVFLENCVNDEKDKEHEDINEIDLNIEGNCAANDENIQGSHELSNGEIFFCEICKISFSNFLEERKHYDTVLIHKIHNNPKTLENDWFECLPYDLFNCHICNVENIKGHLNLMHHIIGRIHHTLAVKSKKPEMILKDGHIVKNALLVETAIRKNELNRNLLWKYFCNKCKIDLPLNLMQCKMHLDIHHRNSIKIIEKELENPKMPKFKRILQQNVHYQCPICNIKIGNLKHLYEHFKDKDHLIYEDLVKKSLEKSLAALFKTSMENTTRNSDEENKLKKKQNEIEDGDDSDTLEICEGPLKEALDLGDIKWYPLTKVYKCLLCDFIFANKQVAHGHLNGKKHENELSLKILKDQVNDGETFVNKQNQATDDTNSVSSIIAKTKLSQQDQQIQKQNHQPNEDPIKSAIKQMAKISDKLQRDKKCKKSGYKGPSKADGLLGESPTFLFSFNPYEPYILNPASNKFQINDGLNRYPSFNQNTSNVYNSNYVVPPIKRPYNFEYDINNKKHQKNLSEYSRYNDNLQQTQPNVYSGYNEPINIFNKTIQQTEHRVYSGINETIDVYDNSIRETHFSVYPRYNDTTQTNTTYEDKNTSKSSFKNSNSYRDRKQHPRNSIHETQNVEEIGNVYGSFRNRNTFQNTKSSSKRLFYDGSTQATEKYRSARDPRIHNQNYDASTHSQNYDAAKHSRNYDASKNRKNHGDSTHNQNYDSSIQSQSYDESTYSKNYDASKNKKNYSESTHSQNYDASTARKNYGASKNSNNYDTVNQNKTHSKATQSQNYDTSIHRKNHYISKHSQNYDASTHSKVYRASTHIQNYDASTNSNNNGPSTHSQNYDASTYHENAASTRSQNYDASINSENNVTSTHSKAYGTSTHSQNYDVSKHSMNNGVSTYSQNFDASIPSENHGVSIQSQSYDASTYSDNYATLTHSQDDDASTDIQNCDTSTNSENLAASAHRQFHGASVYITNYDTSTHTQNPCASTHSQDLGISTDIQNCDTSTHSQDHGTSSDTQNHVTSTHSEDQRVQPLKDSENKLCPSTANESNLESITVPIEPSQANNYTCIDKENSPKDSYLYSRNIQDGTSSLLGSVQVNRSEDLNPDNKLDYEKVDQKTFPQTIQIEDPNPDDKLDYEKVDQNTFPQTIQIEDPNSDHKLDYEKVDKKTFPQTIQIEDPNPDHKLEYEKVDQKTFPQTIQIEDPIPDHKLDNEKVDQNTFPQTIQIEEDTSCLKHDEEGCVPDSIFRNQDSYIYECKQDGLDLSHHEPGSPNRILSIKPESPTVNHETPKLIMPSPQSEEASVSYKLSPLELSPSRLCYINKSRLDAHQKRMDLLTLFNPSPPSNFDKAQYISSYSPMSPEKESQESALPKLHNFNSKENVTVHSPDCYSSMPTRPNSYSIPNRPNSYSMPTRPNNMPTLLNVTFKNKDIKTEYLIEDSLDEGAKESEKENRQVLKDLREYVMEGHSHGSPEHNNSILHDVSKYEANKKPTLIKEEINVNEGIKETLQNNKSTFIFNVKDVKTDNTDLVKQELLNEKMEIQDESCSEMMSNALTKNTILSACLILQNYYDDLGIYGPPLEHVVSQCLSDCQNMQNVIQMVDFNPLMELLVNEFEKLIENSEDYIHKKKYNEGLAQIYNLILLSKEFVINKI